MVLDDYKKMIDGFSSQLEDKSPLLELENALSDDLATLEASTAEVENLKGKIKELEQANVKLYVQLSDRVDPNVTEEPEPAMGTDVLNEFMNLLEE